MPGPRTSCIEPQRDAGSGKLSRRSSTAGQAATASLQTHANLAHEELSTLADVQLSPSLRVVYLYGNQLTSLQGLTGLHQLTHLYLQDNQLRSLEGLGQLPALRKLYLDGNCLDSIHGLEACPVLEELHISNQRLPAGTAFNLDPGTLQQLGGSLVTLQANGLGLSSCNGLSQLRRLQALSLVDNCITDMTSLQSWLPYCVSLKTLDLRGSAACKQHKYRADVVCMARQLVELDGRPVTLQEREFLLRMRSRRSLSATNLMHNDDRGLGTACQQQPETKLVASKRVPVPSTLL